MRNDLCVGWKKRPPLMLLFLVAGGGYSLYSKRVFKTYANEVKQVRGRIAARLLLTGLLNGF